ncbi:CapA family protein [Rhodopila globiformis]|uniref:Capsule synthesis protein CapA domain-containing protein n=1 Tax=Rhodopila globiformis TaxID=1071 RepID=A0A2S6MY97_RHOGL|nr:CapA family protein [Rhodopila globiformis]PPQ27343.1 hypothetical protein CCS01_27745 [Rhodopila globiformis]
MTRSWLHEPFVRSAADCVHLAEAADGPSPHPAGPDCVWGDALAVLDAAQLVARMVNLETASTTHDNPWPKSIHYRMHPDNVAVLTAARIDCCVLDRARAGLLETIATLHRAGIQIAGAGRDGHEAAVPGALDLQPMPIRYFRLNRPSAPDAAWLHDVLARESGSLGARIVPRGDNSFALTGGSACA